MRLTLLTFLGGCLLGLIVGCGGKAGKVEIPKNAAPLPNVKPTLSGGLKGPPKLPAPPAPGARPMPPKK